MFLSNGLHVFGYESDEHGEERKFLIRMSFFLLQSIGDSGRLGG